MNKSKSDGAHIFVNNDIDETVEESCCRSSRAASRRRTSADAPPTTAATKHDVPQHSTSAAEGRAMTKTVGSPSARRASTNSPNTSSIASKLSPRSWNSLQQQQRNNASFPQASEHATVNDKNDSKPPKAASLLKQIVTKNHQQAILEEKQKGSPRHHDQPQELTHDGNNASIVLDEQLSIETPWTPKSLGRAKTAIIYKVREFVLYMSAYVRWCSNEPSQCCIAANAERHAAGSGAQYLLFHRVGSVLRVASRRPHPDVQEPRAMGAGTQAR